MNLVWLGQPECHNISVAGGKASNLSRLVAEFPVPPGFCLTAAAFAQCIPDRDTADLPTEIRDILKNAYQTLAEYCGTEPKVAVRSSAVNEDGQGASFAGQYETFLNVIGIEALFKAVSRCRASFFSSRVRAYQSERGISEGSTRISVLVQHLIPADVSAVVFTVNPVTGNSEEIVINANWGLGESIVGGTVTPDTYVLRKKDLSITGQNIAEKQRMTVMTEHGTREVPVPGIMSSQPAMSDTQKIETARMALSLENKMGWPADIECAWKADKIFLLQCRPVTVLS
ncbi:MAG: hypothetical protein GY795_12880 [Desulfobacterales bacterium]|nr:hypothetical protein [Desulfobacterales bacterium]